MTSVDVLFPIDEGRAIRNPCGDCRSGIDGIYETMYFHSRDDDELHGNTRSDTMRSQDARANTGNDSKGRNSIRWLKRSQARSSQLQPLGPTIHKIPPIHNDGTPTNGQTQNGRVNCNVQVAADGKSARPCAGNNARPVLVSPVGEQQNPVLLDVSNRILLADQGASPSNASTPHHDTHPSSKLVQSAAVPVTCGSGSVAAASASMATSTSISVSCSISMATSHDTSGSMIPKKYYINTNTVPTEIHIIEEDEEETRDANATAILRKPPTKEAPFNNNMPSALQNVLPNNDEPLDASILSEPSGHPVTTTPVGQPALGKLLSSPSRSLLKASSSTSSSSEEEQTVRTPLEMERLLATQSTKMAAKNEYTLLQQLQAKQEVIDMLSEEVYRSRMRIHGLMSQVAVGNDDEAKDDQNANNNTARDADKVADRTRSVEPTEDSTPDTPPSKSRSLPSRRQRRQRRQRQRPQRLTQDPAKQEEYDPTIYLKSGILLSTFFVLCGGRPILLMIMVLVWITVDMIA